MAVGISTVAHDSWPPRVLVVVTGATVGQTLTVYRVVGGVRRTLRSGAAVEMRYPGMVIVDAELPFGVPVYYVVRDVDTGTDLANTSPVTTTLTGGNVALSDATTALAAEVKIASWPEKRRRRAGTVHVVGGVNKPVLGPRGQFEGQIEVVTETDAQREALDALLDGATSGVVQLRQPGGYEGVDCYVAVVADGEERWSQDGTDPRRVVALDVVETSAWAASLPARGSTLADLAAAYSGDTLADLAADYPAGTLMDVAVVDWTAV